MANSSISQRFKLNAFFLLLGLLFLNNQKPNKHSWGFAGHERINEFAIYLLPSKLQAFFIQHLPYIMSQSVAPDKRRYISEIEAPRHYIDLDHYYVLGQDPFWNLPQNWQEAVDCHSEDTLQAYGIVPWHVIHMKYRLQKAFEQKDLTRTLKYAAEIGHYIADAHVPLHTTENYNGQFTNQLGIHGLWESRLVEIEADNFNFWIGPAQYLPSVQKAIWSVIHSSHAALDSVFKLETLVSAQILASQKYSYEYRGSTLTKVYSREFCNKYHHALNGMVERRMRAAILMVSSVWYTAWVDAGQPNLKEFQISNYENLESQDLDSTRKANSRWKQRSCH